MRWQPEDENGVAARTGPQPPSPVLSPEALGWWALQFTPRVAWLDEALVLEVSACERLWGGRRQLLRQMDALNPVPPHRLRKVLGATAPIALARLRLFAAGRHPPENIPADLPPPAPQPLAGGDLQHQRLVEPGHARGELQRPPA
ncbi:MAG: hypothetical protein EOP73_19370, partial [Variovorax sp.]